MVDIKFSEFPKATESKNTDEIAILQDGVNKMIPSPILESKIINRTVQELSKEGGISLNLVNLKGIVATYADLPTTGLQVNDAYQVESDGLAYIWNGTNFQHDGQGIKIQPNVIGVVEEGNTNAVSGGEVYGKTLKPLDLGLGKNKFNKDLISTGFYINQTNGEIMEGNIDAWAILGFDVTNFSDKITFSGIQVSNRAYSFVDVNNNILSFGNFSNGTTTLIKPLGAIKLNFTVRYSAELPTVINTIQIEDGDIATGYEEPNVQYIKGLPISINEETKKSIINILYGQNVIPEDSILNNETAVTPTTAGEWLSWVSATFEKNEGLVVSPINTNFSGLRHNSILSKIKTGDSYVLEFEMRSINNSPTIGLYPEIATNPILITDLSNSFKKYKFNLIRGGTFTDGRLTIGKPSGYVNYPFEIKNVSIYQEQVINKLVDAVFPNSNELVSIVGDSISTALNNNAYELEILPSDVGNNISYYPTHLDSTSGLTIGGVDVTNAMVGVLTTFTPDSSDVGKKLGEPANYNTLPDGAVWWEKVIDNLNWDLCQNVSWSGSTASTNRSTGNFRGSYSWHDRTIRTLKRRDSQGNWILPTKIIHYRGTNDFSYEPYAIVDNQYNVVNGYPTTDVRTDLTIGYKESISIFIKKCRQEYPLAEIILCTLNNFKRVTYDRFPTRNPHNTIIDFNNAVRECANIFGCRVIEFDKDNITFENMYPTYINDSASIPTHPNILGHDMMAKKAIKDLNF